MLEGSWNGTLKVLLEWRPARAVGMTTCKCCLILETNWNGAVRGFLWRGALKGCFRRGVLGGFLEGCSWMEEGFRRSQKGALAHHMSYYPNSSNETSYPEIPE